MIETEILDSAQMEQEIEKEGLEVTSVIDGEEEDATLADVEGLKNILEQQIEV